MIRHRGHSISAEFAGIGRPDGFAVRRASGTEAVEFCGAFESVAAAMNAIDRRCRRPVIVPVEPEWSPYRDPFGFGAVRAFHSGIAS